MDSLQLILLGPPGTDVGAQAVTLSERWQVPCISADSLLDGSDLEENLGRLRRRFEQPDVMLNGFVLEGFPRTLSEAKAFDEMISKFGLAETEVAYIMASTGILINRLLPRKEAGESVSSIRERIMDYKEHSSALLDYYQERSRLHMINGNRSAAEVTNDLVQLGREETGSASFIKDEVALDRLIEKESLLVVDCIASWCGPCKLVSPLIDQLAEEYGDQATVVKLDFDSNRQVAKRFGLKGMPSVMFFQKGQLVETLRGVKPYKVYSDTMCQFL
ncbi:Thioredoxin domain protein [Synechococcus sp. PCC 7335]|uniref:nucleoside monophosphate kinase n=1 Tax=Synechococcus sp. (strain ATCC 29403 / PCC 7335) TaxID=91464 RepID=UPI00017EBC4F|nr:nucleoside monophosphate kinase [Synechococcus sp. PCC 7335]EDX86663.1 Thioredoxin domain protein [Synechococcus sp. PCC 7335]